MRYFGDLDEGGADDPDGDGRDNAQEQGEGSDPADFFNGALPTLTKISGDGQTCYGTNRYLPEPLVVAATEWGEPVPAAPMAFEVTDGDGLLSPTNDGSGLGTRLEVAADAQGRTSLYLWCGSAFTQGVTVAAISGTETASVAFACFLHTGTVGVVVSKVSGDGQQADPGQFAPVPLVAGLFDEWVPVEGGTLAFEVSQGSGMLSPTNDGTGLTNAISLAADSNGLARVYFRYGSIHEETNAITVSAPDNPGATPAVFRVEASVCLEETTDTDEDGIPDAWELSHGLSPSNPFDANGDPDGDGLINAVEYARSTNPHNANSDNAPDGNDGQDGDPNNADKSELDEVRFAVIDLHGQSGNTWSAAYGLNNRGDAVGEAGTPDGNECVAWLGGQKSVISPANTAGGWAMRINDSRVVGGSFYDYLLDEQPTDVAGVHIAHVIRRYWDDEEGQWKDWLVDCAHASQGGKVAGTVGFDREGYQGSEDQATVGFAAGGSGARSQVQLDTRPKAGVFEAAPGEGTFVWHESQAHCISDDGRHIAGNANIVQNAGTDEQYPEWFAAIFGGGGPKFLRPWRGYAQGVNDAGEAVGTDWRMGEENPVAVHHKGKLTMLGPGKAWGINTNGWIVGESGGQAMLWRRDKGDAFKATPLTDCIGGTSNRWQIARAFDINRSGAIAGMSLDKNDGISKAVILLPIELRDINDHADTGDDVTITPWDTTQPIANQNIAWIDAHTSNQNPAPRMPQLEFRMPGLPQGITIEAKLEVKYERGNGARHPSRTDKDGNTDTVKIPADGNFKSVTADTWQIWNEYPLQTEGFFGGDATLTYKLKSGTTEILAPQTIKFRIGGSNPDPATARQFIESLTNAGPTGNLWFAYAIAKSETKDRNNDGTRYNHFWRLSSAATDNYHATRQTHAGRPVWGNDGGTTPGGYGLFQVTGNADDATANIPRRQIWNWQDNARAGLVILESKRAIADAWMTRQKNADNANGVALPSLTVRSVTFADGTNRTMNNAVTMKAWNGASAAPSGFSDPDGAAPGFIIDPQSGGHFCYWKNSASGTNKWALSRYNNPPGDIEPFNYVDRVCQEVE